jgi:hypothetical protein
MLVIRAVINKTQFGTNLYNGIINHIITLRKKIDKFKLYHVKQHLNSLVDHQVKVGARLSKGEMMVNGVGGAHVLP